jgi:hypothetical protein
MAGEQFVGREDAVKRLTAVLTGEVKAGRRLTVQSIEGPGGIGKTYLLDHVLTTVDLTDRNYLTLRADGGDAAAARSLVRVISQMVDGAQADAIRNRQSSGSYFPRVAHVLKTIETIRSEAIADFQKRCPNNKEGQLALSRFLDLAFEAAKRINDLDLIAKKKVDFHKLDKVRRLIEEMVPKMESLREEAVSIWEFFGLFGGDRALRNEIKENACRPLAKALDSDLSAVLRMYRPEDAWKPTQDKVAGIDRLLLIVDDYEALQESMACFLVEHFLPMLRRAYFESVVIILGRDQLPATHAGWDQQLSPNRLKALELAPLSRLEMDRLVESHLVVSQEEKERAWRETQGYPFFVQLWAEETEGGGRSALMLKRFHDRITRWMNDKQRSWLQHALFIDEVNVRTLRKMLGDGQAAEEAEEACKWFQSEGSVRDTVSKVWRVREYVRSRLIEYLRCSDPDRCEELERRGQVVAGGRSPQGAAGDGD